MTKINVTDVVTDNATCSTINDMDIDVAADVASDVAGDDDVYMSMMWKVLVTWQVTSAPQPISGWIQFCVGHKLGPNISQPAINFQLTKFSTQPI